MRYKQTNYKTYKSSGYKIQQSGICPKCGYQKRNGIGNPRENHINEKGVKVFRYTCLKCGHIWNRRIRT